MKTRWCGEAAPKCELPVEVCKVAEKASKASLRALALFRFGGDTDDRHLRNRPRRCHILCRVMSLTALLVMSVPAGAFECPVPEKLTRPGVLKETSSQMAALTSALTSGDASNHVSTIIAELRRRYPNAENAEVANYLVAAYCPATAQLSGLSDAEKRMRIDRFASQIRQMIWPQANAGAAPAAADP